MFGIGSRESVALVIVFDNTEELHTLRGLVTNDAFI